MKQLRLATLCVAVASFMLLAGCTQAAPTPTQPPAAATKAPAVVATAAPTKAAEATKAPAAAPTQAAAPTKTASFPEKGKPVTIIVAYPPGGGSDVAARALAIPLERELGTTIQILNESGAGGQVALTQLARAKADGYTIGYTPWSVVTAMYQDPRRQAVFTRKSFQPIANHVIEPQTIGVLSSSPYKTMKDLVDAAKANPDKITAGFSGLLNPGQLTLAELQRATGTKFAAVAFDGTAPAVTALLGGHVQAVFNAQGAFLPHVKSGAVRLLGILDTQKSDLFPDVPTAEAQGYKVYFGSTRGLSLPAGPSKDVLEVLSRAMKNSMEDQGHKAKMQELGIGLRYIGPEEMDKYWADLEAQMAPLVEMLIKEETK